MKYISEAHLTGMDFSEPESESILMQELIKLPKVDLHRHLSGSISAKTAVRLAAKHHVIMPSYIESELNDQLFSETSVSNHSEYFKPWPVLNQLMYSLGAIPDIISAVLKDAAEDNVCYLELRMGPWGLMGETSYSFEDFIDTVELAVENSNAQYHITTKCIIGVSRHVFRDIPEILRNKLFRKMLDVIRQKSDIVVGVDLNGDESSSHSSNFKYLFDVAYEMGIPVTIHAGELCNNSSEIEYAVDILNASRIGHGISSATNSATLSMLSDRNCLLEICPTSNLFLGVIENIGDLPLQQLEKYGVPYTICTDNPVRCRTTLSEELFLVSRAFSFSIENVRQIMVLAVAASFSDRILKQELQKIVEQTFSCEDAEFRQRGVHQHSSMTRRQFSS